MVDSLELYKIGANLYDRDRFAPVFITLLLFWIFSNSPAGSAITRADHPEIHGVSVIQMPQKLCEIILKIIIQFQAIGFRCFRTAIDYGTGLYSCNRIASSLFSSYRYRIPKPAAQRYYCPWESPHQGIKEHFHVSLLIDRVLETFPGLAFLRYPREIFSYPHEIWSSVKTIQSFFCMFQRHVVSSR